MLVRCRLDIRYTKAHTNFIRIKNRMASSRIIPRISIVESILRGDFFSMNSYSEIGCGPATSDLRAERWSKLTPSLLALFLFFQTCENTLTCSNLIFSVLRKYIRIERYNLLLLVYANTYRLYVCTYNVKQNSRRKKKWITFYYTAWFISMDRWCDACIKFDISISRMNTLTEVFSTTHRQ